MTVIKLLAAIPFFVFAKVALTAGQPVLTEANSIARLVGLSVEAEDFGTSPDEGVEDLVSRTGEDQTWDITGLVLGSPSSMTDYYTAPNSGMPASGDPRLSDANLVTVSDSIRGKWTYHRIDSTGRYLMASVALKDVDGDGRRDTLLTVYDPVSTVFTYPLTMGSVWADSSTQTLEFHDSPPVPVATVVASHTVEGWGTLITPHGSAPALRIRSESRTTTAGGQVSIDRTIRLVTPVPDGLMDEDTYASGTDIGLDSAGTPISFNYRSHSVSRPIRAEPPFELARDFILEPNYPNPFRYETTIPFSVERPQRVNITVFDILGRKTVELLNRPVTTGSHRITWRAGSNASGVYQVVIRTPSARASRMVILQK